MAKEKIITKKMRHILAALKEKPSNGFEIISQIRLSTNGKVFLTTSELIYALRQMEVQEMIKKIPVASGPPRYKLTPFGQEVLSQEMQDG